MFGGFTEKHLQQEMFQFYSINIWHPQVPAMKKKKTQKTADYRLAADSKYLDVTRNSFVQQNSVDSEMS